MIDARLDQPAFPRSYSSDGHNGMSLRDWFAGQALAGLCGNPGGPFQACDRSGWTMVNCGPNHVARQCYELADAMMVISPEVFRQKVETDPDLDCEVRPADPLADLVAQFSAALLTKLRAAEVKYRRKGDWLSTDWQADCQRKLLEHVAKGDPLDVAAYAAFCWHHGWSTAR